MKKLLSASIAASLLVVPGHLMAKGDQNVPIVVERNVTAEQWAQATSSKLDRNLRVMSGLSGAEVSEGIIQIRFDVVNGEATNLRMIRGTDRPNVDSLARTSVKRLKDLPAVRGSGSSQPVLANIIVAKSPQGFERLSDELAQSERMRMASTDRAKGTLIALNMASRVN